MLALGTTVGVWHPSPCWRGAGGEVPTRNKYPSLAMAGEGYGNEWGPLAVRCGVVCRVRGARLGLLRADRLGLRRGGLVAGVGLTRFAVASAAAPAVVVLCT